MPRRGCDATDRGAPHLYSGHRGVLLAGLAGLLACAGNGPPIVWEGEHARVGSDLDIGQWCPGNLPRLDVYTGEMKALFGASDEVVIDYFLVAEPASENSPCGGAAAACELDGKVFTPWLPHDHEIVHAIGGVRQGFFEEGRASYFGDAYPIDWSSVEDLDVRTFIDDWSHAKSSGRYRLAAHFTGYLVHTYGLQRYVDLVHASSDNQSPDAFGAVFETAFGASVDAAVADYLANWPTACGPDSPRLLHYECNREAIENAPGELVNFDLELSCANPAALGPRPDPQGVPRIWQDITIEHEGTPSSFEFEIPAAGSGSSVVVQIIPCSSDCAVIESQSRIFRPNENPNAWNGIPFEGPPSRYVMRVSADADAGESVRMGWWTYE